MRKTLSCITLSLAAALSSLPLSAAEMDITVEVPRLDVAEYHRPYVAIWVERGSREVVANLAVWYDLEMANGEGKEWLKDMRQWWRRTGRSLDMPVDAFTGATRAPGVHQLTFSGDKEPLGDLPPGDYTLQVEASREVGGREMLTIPFTWPPQQAQQHSAQGENELGSIKLELKP